MDRNVSITEANKMLQHPPWPPLGKHLYGQWTSKDSRTEYRVCLHPKCKVVEERQVK